jgi:hypothetical protein
MRRGQAPPSTHSPRFTPTIPAHTAEYPTLNLCTPHSASLIHDRRRTCSETGIKDLRMTEQPQKDNHPVGLTSARHCYTQLIHTRTTTTCSHPWAQTMNLRRTKLCFCKNNKRRIIITKRT